MQPEEIKDSDSLQEWLKSRPQADSICIANRAAARVAPIWYQEVNGDWGRRHELTSLAVLHPLIISGLAMNLATEDRHLAAASASQVASDASFAAPSDAAASAAAAAAHSADASFAGSFRLAVFDAGDASLLAHDALEASLDIDSAKLWSAVKSDCRLLESGKPLEGAPLWHNDPNPLDAEWQATRTEWQAPNSPYRFWLRWYEAALQGQHLNLDLEQDIAQIPSEDWEKGPGHIASLIDALEERHDLKAQVIALRNQLRELKQRSASVAHRSHNQPPELVDAPTTLNRHVTVVVAALEEAEAELEKPIPDASAIARLGKLLVEAAIRLTKYCGTLADTGLKKAAEELGTTGTKWSIRLIAGDLLIKAEPVQTLGQALISYAQKILAGG
jgi:hypothetical protein